MADYTTIDDPSAHFQTTLYTGNGSDDHAITNGGNSDLQPDFLWFKERANTGAHSLHNSTNSVSLFLESNTTGTEAYDTTTLKSIQSDGFTLGTESNHNQSSTTYVAWQWKANGGTTSSNTDGSLTSTVQANTDAGFSIVTYTGNGGNTTIGHGLGVAPKVVLVRARSRISSWVMFHKDGSTTDDDYYVLQSTAAKGSQAGLWNNQYPSSTVFGASSDLWLNANGSTYVAYCFAEKQGYSKFGSYVGNGNANGAFVYTGFKPAFVMIKANSAYKNWYIWDNKRSPINPVDEGLVPNLSGAEVTGYDPIDILSNGFKLRDADATWNGSGTTTIYMAFAENPFTTSTGIPTTAR